MAEDRLAQILDWFGRIESYIPGAQTWVGEILLGQVPKASAVQAYQLATDWERAATVLREAHRDARRATGPLFAGWRDGVAAQRYREEWERYLDAMGKTADAMESLAKAVRGFAQEIELLKFMVALNLALLAYALFTMIAAAVPTGGIALAGIPAAFSAARAAIGAAVRRALVAIANLSAREVAVSLGKIAGRTLHVLAPRQLARLLRSGVSGLAAGMMPRRVIARTVADRMAARWMQSVAGKEALVAFEKAAGREASTVLAGSMNAMRTQLAAEIEGQLLRRFGVTTAAEAATGAAVRRAEFTMAEEITRRTLRDCAARQIVETSFSRELRNYVGKRALFGAGFMGGGNLVGQTLQVAAGHRSSVDFSQVAGQTIQGGIFGAGMFGGLAGHVIGGGVAGGLVGLGTELDGFRRTGRFDVWNIANNAAHGAAAGAVFGVQGHVMSVCQVPGQLKIGHDVTPLRSERGLGLDAHDRSTGVRVSAAPGRGIAWERVDTTGQRVSQGWVDRTGQVRPADRPGVDSAVGPVRETVREPVRADQPTDRTRYEGLTAVKPVVEPAAGAGAHAETATSRTPESVHIDHAERSDATGTPGNRPEHTVAEGDSDPSAAQSGAATRPRDDAAADVWAAEAYDRFRADAHDVDAMARNLADVARADGRTGFTAEELNNVKHHLLIQEHALDDYEGGIVHRRFDPDPDIAEAWARMRDGEVRASDIVLLEHELTELRYLRDHPGATYREAHQAANRDYNWESLAATHDGTQPRPMEKFEATDGNPDRFSEDPGRQSGGRISVPPDRPTEQVPGDRQGVNERDAEGQSGGRTLPSGAGEDPQLRSGTTELAQSGDVRGVAEATPQRWAAEDLTPTGTRGTIIIGELFRDANGDMHFVGDRVDTWRDATGRLRGDTGFVLDDNKPPPVGVQAVAERAGESRIIPSDGSEPTAVALRQAVVDREVAAAAKEAVWRDEVEPVADALRNAGVTVDRNTFGSKAFSQTLDHATAGGLTELDRIRAGDAAAAYTAASVDLVRASERLGVAGGDHAIGKEFPNNRLVSGGDYAPGTSGNLDRIAFDDSGTPVLLVVEEKGVGAVRETRNVPDPANPTSIIKAEQCSPEYVRELLMIDPKLAQALREDPALGIAMQQAVANGQVRCFLVHTSARGVVTLTEYRLDPGRLHPESIQLITPEEGGT